MSLQSTRRVLLRALMFGAIALAPGLAAAARSRDRAVRPDLRSVLVALLPNRRSAEAVGSAYLERFPAEADVRVLSRSLFSAIAAAPPPNGPAPETLPSTFKARIRRDFAEEHTVWVDGWLLSRTEARLCALRSLV